MEKYVMPPFFNSDFKFPAQFLPMQNTRQAQQSTRPLRIGPGRPASALDFKACAAREVGKRRTADTAAS